MVRLHLLIDLKQSHCEQKQNNYSSYNLFFAYHFIYTWSQWHNINHDNLYTATTMANTGILLSGAQFLARAEQGLSQWEKVLHI